MLGGLVASGATLVSRHSDALRAEGEPLNAALNSGFHLAYLIGAGCIAAAILTALFVLKPTSPMVAGEIETEATCREAA